MKKSLLLGLVFMLLAGTVAAQETPSTAPKTSESEKYVWISTGTINPGKGHTFMNLVKQIKEAAIASNAKFHWLAAYNITGEGRQVTFVTFHNDMASVDTALKVMQQVEKQAAMKNANLMAESAEAEGGGGGSMLAKFRPDLSYNPTKVDGAHATRWMVETIQLKPGTMMDAENLIKEEINLFKKANMDDHWIAYQIISGAPGSTLMFVTPMRSLADMDEMEKQENAYKAVFTPPVRQHFSSVVKSIVAHTNNIIWAVAPEMSHPTESTVAANPDFWTVKEEAPAVASKAKKGKKAPAEPAAMKEEKK